MSSFSRWMIYGANGFTGELCAAEAAARGEKPVLAGRREEAVRPIAERHGFPYRIFSLDDPSAVAHELAEIGTLLLAAGPFDATSAPALTGCVRSRTHYIDITGEVAIFEACRERDAEARAAGISVIPGVGFDVVPSDCLGKSVAEALPGATSLEIALYSPGTVSKGTAKTSLQRMHEGGLVRRDGQYQHITIGSITRDVNFGGRTRRTAAIPWGDVATAYFSTAIPNITVYMAMPEWMVQAMRFSGALAPLLKSSLVQQGLGALVERFVTGPNEGMRERVNCHLWARAEGPGGAAVEGNLVTPEAYRLTAMTSVDAAIRCTRGETAPGYLTPSLAFGASYITQFAGCELKISA